MMAGSSRSPSELPSIHHWHTNQLLSRQYFCAIPPGCLVFRALLLHCALVVVSWFFCTPQAHLDAHFCTWKLPVVSRFSSSSSLLFFCFRIQAGMISFCLKVAFSFQALPSFGCFLVFQNQQKTEVSRIRESSVKLLASHYMSCAHPRFYLTLV